jgi:hypothetical protein
MAALNSIQRAQIAPPNYAPLKPTELEGRVRCAYARIQFQGALIGDVITWFKIPVGARIVGGWLKSTSGIGGAATVTLQDNGAVPLVFIPATNLGAANTIVLMGGAGTHAGLGGDMQGDTTGNGLMQSVIAAANPTNGTILECFVQYVVD